MYRFIIRAINIFAREEYVKNNGCSKQIRCPSMCICLETIFCRSVFAMQYYMDRHGYYGYWKTT